MVSQNQDYREDALSLLLALIDNMALPDKQQKTTAGRKQQYFDRLFLKAAVIMSMKRLNKVFELLTVINEPTRQMQRLRECLTEQEKMPTRRTFERRLAALSEILPRLIAGLGRFLVKSLAVWRDGGRAVALDSTVLRAKDNAVWHKKHQETGQVPHSRIDTEAGWTKSGWPRALAHDGWVYGGKLHVAATVGELWIPVSARLTPANVYDGEIASPMVAELPSEAGFVLGDQHYRTEGMASACSVRGIELVAMQAGKYPHTDSGVEVRRLFHQLRSRAIENFNEHFKGIFDSHSDIPTKGKVATSRFALSAILVYQLGLWARHELGLPPCQGLKPFLGYFSHCVFDKIGAWSLTSSLARTANKHNLSSGTASIAPAHCAVAVKTVTAPSPSPPAQNALTKAKSKWFCGHCRRKPRSSLSAALSSHASVRESVLRPSMPCSKKRRCPAALIGLRPARPKRR